MLSSKDYANMTLEELVAEEKKMQSGKITTAVFIGVLIGIAVWSATHKGGFLTYLLLFFALLIGSRHSRNLKRMQAEISSRESGSGNI